MSRNGGTKGLVVWRAPSKSAGSNRSSRDVDRKNCMN